MLGTLDATLPTTRSNTALMCCYCRRVRTRPGEWQIPDLEPEGRVSHGICQLCLATYHPEIAPSEDS